MGSRYQIVILLSQASLFGFLRADDPCTTPYVAYTDGDRDPSYVPKEDDIPICDNFLTRWYRVKGPLGIDLDMSRTVPPADGCNTHYPIWLNGDLPSDGVDETLKACVRWGGLTCIQELDIGVKNCGNFRVYRLINPGFCPAAFCFDVPENEIDLPCPVDIPDNVQGPFVRTKLGDSDEIIDSITFEEIQFECALENHDVNRFYDIWWYINGNQLEFHSIKVPGGELATALLRESHWEDSFKLGMMVKCSIAVRFNQSCTPGDARTSEDYFAGIKVLDQSVAVKPGETADIRLQSTVPIGCYKINGDLFSCRMQFNANPRLSENFCPPSTTETPGGNQMCGPIFERNLGGTIVTMSVESVNSQVYGNKITHVEITGVRRWPVSKTDVWDGVVLPLITVNVITDTTLIANKYCASYTDPHLITFDGRHYQSHLEGEYIFYRHKQLPYVVQILQQTCTISLTGVCNCGVAIQSGTEIFVYSACKGGGFVPQYPKVKTYNCYSGGLKIINLTPTSSAPRYEVILPTGTKVDIRSYRSVYLDVRVYPSPSDIHHTAGLCGTLDGSLCNEFIHRTGEQTDSCNWDWTVQPTDFIKSWRVQDDERLYVGNLTNDWDVNATHCLCNTKGAIVCNDHLPRVDCILNGSRDLTDIHSQVCKQKREANLDVEEDDLPLPDYDYDAIPEDPTWENGWDEDKARDFCTNYVRDRPFFEICSEGVNIDVNATIGDCIMDILLSGGTTWAEESLESFKNQCYEEVMREKNYWPDESGTESVFDAVVTKICPNECNERGVCVDGQCYCDPDFVGGDCSISTTSPPQRLEIPKGGHCDLSSKPCVSTKVYGETFFDSENLRCRMTEYQVNSTGIYPTGNIGYSEPVIFVSSNEIICPIPEFIELESQAEMPHLTIFTVAVSNDDDKYSEQVLFLRYPSTCFNCQSQGIEGSCSLKEAFCFIDYSCIPENALDPSRPTYVCDPSKSTISWSPLLLTTSTNTNTHEPTSATLSNKPTTTTATTTTDQPTTAIMEASTTSDTPTTISTTRVTTVATTKATTSGDTPTESNPTGTTVATTKATTKSDASTTITPKTETTKTTTVSSTIKPTTNKLPEGCITDCVDRFDGDYQSCIGCAFYATCSNDVITDGRECPANLYWDDFLKACVTESSTCTSRN